MMSRSWKESAEQVADSVLELSDEAIRAEITILEPIRTTKPSASAFCFERFLRQTEVVNGNERTANQHVGRPVR